MKRKQIELTKCEQEVENALLRGEYLNVSKAEFEDIAHAIAARRKDKVLNIRVNSEDLESIKKKAKKLGVKYQTFVSELLHRVAHR